jgi:K+-sensing histidine kinase KdpD
VIGFVRTHGRRRTEQAIGGLEIVPGHQAGGHDGTGRMDLDAVLARRPAVVLVDDFGQHAEAISSLRDAGIDVISTVDVCDLDRAADTVAEFTGRPPTTTVPDAALGEADDIRFVDNSPEALRKRLGHGNIYPAGQAGAARAGLFSTASLAALREIGLRVVAETLAAPGSTRPHQPLDVLVAVAAGAPADALLQRGVRLARPSGATCTVLALARPGRAPTEDKAAAVRSAVNDAGAALMVRESRDDAATIAQAVRDCGARHLVLAGTAARLLERWRLSLAERLADQLPDVHLHITASQAGSAGRSAEGANSPAGVPDTGLGRARGAVRVYLGYAAGCGTTTAMLEEAARRRSRGSDVVVAAVDCHGREAVSAALQGLEATGDGATLDTDAVLARRPDVACIDDLAALDGRGETRLSAARRLADAGITVIATAHIGSMQGSGTGGGPLDDEAVLAFADEIELVDAPPSVLAGRIRRGELIPAAEIEQALRTDYAPETLGVLREQAFTIVAEHADRRRAAYRRGVTASSQARPVILACAAPLAGMEPLIRRAAALAAHLAGDFLVAVVPPSPLPPDLERLLASYGALTSQLGGQFAMLQGAPAAALTTLAKQHRVTEILLARHAGGHAGRHPILRELASSAHGAEVHVLPV